jgi:hypothetical protein
MDITHIKTKLIEKAYKKHPNLVRFTDREEFTDDGHRIVFWYNVPLSNGTQTTKVEVYEYGTELL